MSIASINPTTGETLITFEPLSDVAIDDRLDRARAAFQVWRERPVAERARIVGRAGELLEARQRDYGRIMTLEMGKPIGASIAEAAKCASACRYYAEHAARFVSAETLLDDGEQHAEIRYQPLGVVLAIMPWNFPFWQVIRFAAPALAAGNVGLLKHSSNVPQCAIALEELFRDAGAIDGAFQTLLIGSAAVEGVLSDDRVAAATLTGSEPAGSKVAATAGRMIKKTVLELGGSDAFIVMPSADIAAAAAMAVTARTINNGQSCIAAKRFIVHRDVADDFTRRFVDGMRALRIGDPMDESTQVGPLATPDIVSDLERQVRESVERGARVLCGGHRIDRAGNFYEPTVLADIPADSPAYVEELFGPVASLFVVDSIDDAIRVANDSRFGLGSAAWTNESAEAERFSERLEAGTVTLNGMVASDPRLPFGGVKKSGYGRELGSWGLREFVNIKTVRTMRGTRAEIRTE